MKKKYFRFMVIFIFFIGLMVGFFYGHYSYKDEMEKVIKGNDDKNSLVLNNQSNTTSKIELLQDEFDNSDIKAIFTIDNSGFEEVVVQTTDNKYYLNHDYKKNYDKLGAIYADYRINLDNSHKTLIYGHSSTKRDVPFNYLENYEKEDFYQNHKYITLQTQNDTYKYEIFSVYVETSDFTYMNLNFDTKDDWYLHLLKLKRKSLHESDIELMSDDDILILQTCSTNPKYKKYSKKYLLIVSRRVK